MKERDGILMWMLEGTRMYLKERLKLSPRIKSEAARYRKDSDLIGEFLADKTEADPNAKLVQTTLYEWFKEWCEANGLRQHSKKTFTQRLAERGFGESRSNGERYYLGLKRATHTSPPPQVAV